MQTRSSPSNNNWIPEKTGNLLGTTKNPKQPPTDDQVDTRNPETRADISKKIGGKKKLSISHRSDSEKKIADQFRTPSENSEDIKTLRGP